MAIRRSTALINKLAGGYGVRELLKDARIFMYSGTQPTSADVAPTGTHLATFTKDGAAYVDPVRSIGSITIGGTVGGTIDTIKVGGCDFNLLSEPVAYETSAAATAVLIAANINAKENPFNIVATTNSQYVYLQAPYWWGALADGLTFATTVTGALTATPSGVFAGGTTAQNGLNFLEAVTGGVISKENGIWQGTALANGTAGYFRFVAGGSTVDGILNEDIRFDGTASTSGGDMIVSTVSFTLDSIYTINSGSITEPAS